LASERARPGSCGRLRGAAGALDGEAALDPLGEARQRQLAVAQLLAGVLGHGADHRTGARGEAFLLRVGEDLGGAHVEEHLDP
jgi:hypothetical protein